MPRAASRTWTYGRQNFSPKTSSVRSAHRSRVNSLTVRSKRIRGADPYTVAKRRQVGLRSPKSPSSSARSMPTFCSA